MLARGWRKQDVLNHIHCSRHTVRQQTAKRYVSEDVSAIQHLKTAIPYGDKLPYFDWSKNEKYVERAGQHDKMKKQIYELLEENPKDLPAKILAICQECKEVPVDIETLKLISCCSALAPWAASQSVLNRFPNRHIQSILKRAIREALYQTGDEEKAKMMSKYFLSEHSNFVQIMLDFYVNIHEFKSVQQFWNDLGEKEKLENANYFIAAYCALNRINDAEDIYQYTNGRYGAAQIVKYFLKSGEQSRATEYYHKHRYDVNVYNAFIDHHTLRNDVINMKAWILRLKCNIPHHSRQRDDSTTTYYDVISQLNVEKMSKAL